METVCKTRIPSIGPVAVLYSISILWIPKDMYSSVVIYMKTGKVSNKNGHCTVMMSGCVVCGENMFTKYL